MKEKEIIPIVFATNSGYVPYLGVAIHSLIVHSDKEKEYRISIFYTSLLEEQKRRILSLGTAHVKIEFMKITAAMAGVESFQSSENVLHVTVETMYRFLIPELFPQYHKVLYLDSDIVVLADVAELYSFDLGETALGVASSLTKPDWAIDAASRLDVSLEEIFNAGILLIPTKTFIKEGIKEQSYSLLMEDWKRDHRVLKMQDQDALIVSCRGKVAFFPASWNFSWIQEFSWEQEKCVLSPEEEKIYEETLADLKILHYASHHKPWNLHFLPLADVFWKYAKETVFYEEILFREKGEKLTCLDRVFPWDKVACGSRLVIYGAGNVGRCYLKQVSASAYCFVVAVCDKNAKNLKRELFPVVSPEDLSSLKFDTILIGIESETVAKEIEKNLISLGVPAEKIKW